MNTLTVVNPIGIPFTVRFVEEGGSYGAGFFLTHKEEDPLIEFYDGRYPHTEYGQFVSRYCLSTLKEFVFDSGMGGVNLDGGVSNWFVSGENMQEVHDWLKGRL